MNEISRSLVLSVFTNVNISINNWVVMGGIMTLLSATVYILLKKYNPISDQKNEYKAQSQAIKMERQRISSELHDELGSGLSAIKLYSELAARNKPEIAEILELNEMVKEISSKINDIIWTTSTENDRLDSVIFYIQEQIGKLLKHSDIKFTSELPEIIPELKIKSESRRDFYLLSKEIAHNALKHAHASEISLHILIINEVIVMNIRDNGKGFDPFVIKNNGMGLSNINHRIARLGGSLTIENYKGTKVIVNIPIIGNFYDE